VDARREERKHRPCPAGQTPAASPLETHRGQNALACSATRRARREANTTVLPTQAGETPRQGQSAPRQRQIRNPAKPPDQPRQGNERNAGTRGPRQKRPRSQEPKAAAHGFLPAGDATVASSRETLTGLAGTDNDIAPVATATPSGDWSLADRSVNWQSRTYQIKEVLVAGRSIADLSRLNPPTPCGTAPPDCPMAVPAARNWAGSYRMIP